MFALIVRLEGEKQGRQFSHVAKDEDGNPIGIHRYPKSAGRWARSYYVSKRDACQAMAALAELFPNQLTLSVREVR